MSRPDRNLFRRKRQSTPNWSTEFPEGSFIHTERGYFYVFSASSRYYFLTKRVLDSWSPQRIIECSESDRAVQGLAIYAKMKFRSGSLLYHHGSGNLYLVVGTKARRISNPLVMDWLNLDRNKAIWVSDDEINLHEMGRELN